MQLVLLLTQMFRDSFVLCRDIFSGSLHGTACEFHVSLLSLFSACSGM